MAIPTFGMYVYLRELILFSKNVAIVCGMYIINGVHGQEPRSSGGNTSSNSQVSALIPRPAFNGMERVCQRHGSNQNSHLLLLVRKPLGNQFIHYHISSRGNRNIYIYPIIMTIGVNKGAVEPENLRSDTGTTVQRYICIYEEIWKTQWLPYLISPGYRLWTMDMWR